MTTQTQITAAPQAAGAARLRVSSLAVCAGTTLASYAPVVHQVSGHPTTWGKGAIAESATFMAFDGKNRPTRPLSELSP